MITLTQLQAEINFAWEEGHKAARERGRVLLLVASMLSFVAGAVLF